jgi:hypothetical protein
VLCVTEIDLTLGGLLREWELGRERLLLQDVSGQSIQAVIDIV